MKNKIEKSIENLSLVELCKEDKLSTNGGGWISYWLGAFTAALENGDVSYDNVPYTMRH